MPNVTTYATKTEDKDLVINGQTISLRSIYPDNGSSYLLRNGDNTPGIRNNTKTQRVKPPLVWKSFPDGPKTGMKVWVYSRKQKKHILVSERLTVQRLVPDYSVFKKKPKKKTKRVFTKPNRLSFRKFTCFYDASQGVAAWRNTQWNSTGSLGGFILGAASSYPDSGYFNGSFNLQNYTNPTRLAPGYDSVVSELDRKALDSLYEKVKGQKVNIAQMFAERKQSIELLNAGIKRAVTAFANLKRGRIKKAFGSLFPKNLREGASLPLIYNFGIVPLISDIDGLIQELKSGRPIDLVVKASGIKRGSEVIYDSTDTDQFGVYKAKSLVKVDYSITVRYVVRVEATGLLSDASRLGLTNPLSLMYELTPWSFFFDWLLPVGEYINNQDAFYGWSVKDIHKTVFYKQTVYGSREISGNSEGFIENLGTAKQSFKTELVEVNRSVLTNVPGLPFPRPQNPIKLPRVINATALFNQLLLRK